MSKTKSELHILLLQIRDTPRVRQEEHQSFAKYSGLRQKQIAILNVFDVPYFSPDVVDRYDALFVGGASEASVLEPEHYDFLVSSQKLLHHCIERELPVFASCFGFQLAVVALGGEILRDEKDFELGTIPISLSDAARHDPLFYDTPNPFLAVSGHKERTLYAPAGCQTLAYTDACCHAFRIDGKPFWSFQFHPEVEKKTLAERLTIFKEQYTENDQHLRRVLSNLSETPESNKLLRKFVDRVLLGA